MSYLDDQRQATGHVPDDRTLVVERFRDELGDWRVVLHSPYGDRVHAPWALAITARLRERYGGMDVQALHTDDGIIIRVPDSDEPPPAGIALLDPDEIGDIITAEVGGSRAVRLPVPRVRRPGAAAPPAPAGPADAAVAAAAAVGAQLLEIAAQFPGFPITLETVRECLQDVFDVPALTEVLRDLAARRIRLVEVETATPSPFGRNLLFRYVGAFMYEGDAPLAERRAQALALDPALLAELLGTEALRELLDPAVVAETEADLQHLSAGAAVPGRGGRRRPAAHVRAADRRGGGGPVRGARSPPATGWRGSPPTRRAHRGAGGRAADVGGDRGRRAAAGRARRGAAGRHPRGVHRAAARPARRPGGALGADARAVRRRRRWRSATGSGSPWSAMTLRRLAADGRVAEGEFLADARGTQWCDSGVLRMLRRRCLARLRKEAEPVPPAVLGRFLPAWHGIGSGRVAAAGRRRGPRGDRAAGGRAGARVRAGDAGAARAGCPATPPRCSTSSPRRARWSGPGRARSAAGTAGWCSRPPSRRRCCCPSRAS